MSESHPPRLRLEVAILSGRTHEGMVELRVGETATQMDLAKAREVLAMLSGAIEAAVSDQLFYRYFTETLGFSEELAAAALGNFRELRQGSRHRVYPH